MKKTNATLGNSSTRARTGAWQSQFLSILATTANIADAARAAGIERSTAYRQRAADAEFAAKWDDALEQAIEALELEARRRALGEVKSYKFDRNGQPLLHPETGEAYFERQASDLLLVTLLKAHKPEVYKDRTSQEITATVAPATPALDYAKLTPDELRTLRALHAKALPDAGPAPLALPAGPPIELLAP